MKTKSKILMAFILGICLSVPAAYAKPERMAIKDPMQRQEMKTAKQAMNRLDLSRIQDPEARRAIHQILQYLKAQGKRK